MRISSRVTAKALTALACGLAICGATGVHCQAQAARHKTPPTVDPSTLADLPADAGDGDFAIGPQYANAPETAARDNVPKGTIYHFSMNSTDSKIYSGIAKNAPGQVVPYHRTSPFMSLLST